MIRAVVFALLVAFAAAKSTHHVKEIKPLEIEDIEYCNMAGHVYRVILSTGCTKQPCEIKIGSRVVLHADFRPSETSAHMVLIVTTRILGIPIELTNEIIPSPVEAGNDYRMEYIIEEVPDLHFGLTLLLEVNVLAQSSTMECCARASVKIVS